MSNYSFTDVADSVISTDRGIDWSDAPPFGRTKSLKLALEFLHLINPDAPTIVETGTTRGDLGGGPTGDGWATLAFGWYCKKYKGSVFTVDILEEAILQCKAITKDYESVIQYVVGDSIEFLSRFFSTIDFLYLDSADDPEVIDAELQAAYDSLSAAAVVVIDDTHDKMTRGKGVIACKFLLENGWDLQSESGGQVLFTRGVIFNLLNSDSPYEREQAIAEDLIKLDFNDYDGKAKIWHSLFVKALPPKEALPLVEDGEVKVLDLGCNTGYNTKFFERIYGTAVGVDINPRLLFASRVNEVECYGMSVDCLGFPDNSFSLVVAKDILEHTTNPTKAIEEAYRVLTEGGYFSCMIWLDGDPGELDDVVIHPAFNFNNLQHRWKATVYGVLARVFGAGFTDVSVGIHKHSAVFGEVRPYGDVVLVLSAKKKKDIIKVPVSWFMPPDYCWTVFVTLLCTGTCDYCIAKLSPTELSAAKNYYEKEALSPEEWVPFLNRLQRFEKHKLGVVGGEPTLYKGMFDLINALDGYSVTVTSNLKTEVFNNIEKFCDSIENKEFFRLNTSFHPDLISVDEFCDKIQALRNGGIFVDQVAMVDFPGSGFSKYHHEFIKKGIALSPQTFLGIQRGTLYPNSTTPGITNEPVEHGIFDEELYEAGFSCKEKSEMACHTRRFLLAPNGDVYKCHYHLYSNRSSLFNIKEVEERIPVSGEFTMCNDFGFCNPCDSPHIRFRAPILNLRHVVDKIMTGHPESWDSIKKVIDDLVSVEGAHKIVSDILARLHMADNPLWALYNDERIITGINDLVLLGDFVDNTAAYFLAHLELTIFRMLPNGFNFYRILSEEALYKYTSGLATFFREMYESWLTLADFEYLDKTAVRLVRNNLARILQSHAALDRDFRFFHKQEIKEEEE